MALFPVSSSSVQIQTSTPASSDQFSNGVRLKSDASAVFVASSGGQQVSNGLLLDANGAIVCVGATSGLPAGTQYVNGLPISSAGALCVSTNAVDEWINGLPFDANGALVTNTSLGSNVSFIAASNGNGIASLPVGWQPGDLAVVFAYRYSNANLPGDFAGYTPIASGSLVINAAFRLKYRVLQTGDGDITSTNAQYIVIHVYRGQNVATPIGGSAVFSAAGPTDTVTFPTLTMTQSNGTSYVAGFFGKGNDLGATWATPPTGMVNRNSASIASPGLRGASHDTNGGVASWTGQSVNTGDATGVAYYATTVEIISS